VSPLVWTQKPKPDSEPPHGTVPVGLALFGSEGDALVVPGGQQGVGHHQERGGPVLRLDLLATSLHLGRGSQEPRQAPVGLDGLHAVATGQPRDEVRRGGPAHPTLAAGSGRGRGDDVGGVEIARPGCQRHA